PLPLAAVAPPPPPLRRGRQADDVRRRRAAEPQEPEPCLRGGYDGREHGAVLHPCRRRCVSGRRGTAGPGPGHAGCAGPDGVRLDPPALQVLVAVPCGTVRAPRGRHRHLVDRTHRIWSIRRPSRPGAFGAEAGATFPASGGPQARGPGAASLRSFGCAPPNATLSLAPAAWDAGLTSLRPAPAPAVTVH